LKDERVKRIFDLMKIALLVSLLIASAAGATAQDTDTVQKERSDFIISGNLAGGASLLSLGFDKLFFLKPALTLSAKVGFGFNTEFQLFSSEPPTNYFILPHNVTCNFGRNRSFLELGMGAAWVTDNSNHYYLVYPILGYRYHPFKNPGFSFRVWVYYPLGKKNFFDWDVIMLVPYGLSFGIAL
jgi:hypothetical protein